MKLFLSILCCIGLWACSPVSPLQVAMQDMAGAYKSMKKSANIAQVEAELIKFKQALAVAQQQKIPTAEQANFDKGLNKIVEHTDKLTALVKQGDLALVKLELTALDESKTFYHEKVIKE